MSRYYVDHPTYDVYVGWDDPLETFFLSVVKPAPNNHSEDEEVFSAGFTPKEITTVGGLQKVCSRYQVEMPQDLVERLGEDLDNGEGPTPLQSWARRFF